jgi:fructokinase
MLLSCGDALIDWIPARSEDGREAYIPAVGGSCCNIAIAMGRLGASAGFMGGISTDLFGDMLVAGLRSSNVSTRYVARVDRETTLGFVRLGEGEPQYAFYDDGTASRMWRRTDSPAPGPEVALLHVGSVTLINPPVADECLALFEAEKGKRLLSVDPNCRPTLTRDVATYRRRTARLLALADIIRLSATDLAFIEPGLAPEEAARRWLADGASLVVITHGADGAMAWWRGGTTSMPARPVNAADTIGAGDSFFAGLVVNLAENAHLTVEGLARLDEDALRSALAFGATVAAITCTRRGADPPWRKELPSQVPGALQ